MIKFKYNYFDAFNDAVGGSIFLQICFIFMVLCIGLGLLTLLTVVAMLIGFLWTVFLVFCISTAALGYATYRKIKNKGNYYAKH